ncbi:RecB family exonuclease [Parendozoicomonas haliclonae]|uniref:PD-(D/E)XK nuclease superfamily protein n=1 Tax=Parendozoicomonas haliclonae TaxID=1960125 RepID=A0A1X7AEM1_9GAMM|nr:PD-(D/E)XK nuclease family protein [Parendozoicomonas haliclonae]SMA33608.1 PD-(D/E)XK nuclease superfamily protein [Parendozoicomonas haliclonae]
MQLFNPDAEQAPLIADTPEPKKIPLLEREPQCGDIRTWSVSSIQVFEDCPYRIYLSKVKKCPEPPAEALERGSRIHELLENFVMGHTEEDTLGEVKYFIDEAKRFREGYAEGKVIVEDDWAYNTQWEPTGWVADDTWGRMKLDIMVFEDETSAEINDWKTGKKYPMKAGFQGMVYALGAFARYPKLEFIKSRFLYVDKGDTFEKTYTRGRMDSLKERINLRALALTTETHFPPKPAKWSCRFCPHRETGNCEFAEN